MFTLVKEPQFTHDVTVTTPVDGGFREDTFKARFRVLDVDTLATYPLSSTMSSENAAFLRDVVVSFEDIVGEDEKPLPYNDQLRDQVITQPAAQMALMNVYLNAISKVKRGN